MMVPSSTVSSTTTVSWIPKLKTALTSLLLPLALTGCGSSDRTQIPINPNLKLRTQQTTGTGEVFLTLQAFDEENYPLTGLTLDEVTVEVDGQVLGSSDRQGGLDLYPQDSAYIAVLVDFSGSMNELAQPLTRQTELTEEPQSKAVTALATLQTLVDELAEDKNPPHLTILPFGEPTLPTDKDPDGTCLKASEYTVTPEQLQPDKFAVAGDEALQAQLDDLETKAKSSKVGEEHEYVCAATNLYDPIEVAINALGNENNEDFHPPEPRPTPRLGIIVISDGYDSVSSTEKEDQQRFKTLIKRLKQGRQQYDITVHTLGYGLTPEELGTKYQLGHPATRSDVQQINAAGKIPAEEFVDQERLKAIAQAGGGFNEFAADADQVEKSLDNFFKAIQGGYIISYRQPGADRGSRHTVQVTIESADGINSASPELSYRMPLGFAVPYQLHLAVLGGTLLSLGLGYMIFDQWSQTLKRLEEEG